MSLIVAGDSSTVLLQNIIKVMAQGNEEIIVEAIKTEEVYEKYVVDTKELVGKQAKNIAALEARVVLLASQNKQMKAAYKTKLKAEKAAYRTKLMAKDEELESSQEYGRRWNAQANILSEQLAISNMKLAQGNRNF